MKRITTVRYGQMRARGLFEVSTSDEISAGDACVVQTPRGYELGTVLARPIEENSGGSGCGESACGSCASSQGKIMRRATRDDREAFESVERDGINRELHFARRRARELKLEMKVNGAEYLLRKDKLIFHFSSGARVDFRDLVKDLAKEFKTRIELKQVGARDEARLVGDMASCGRELCCRSFLHDLQPVSMRMAKHQKKTLDPTKISGQCGKLKCCLRYEDEVYTELQKTLPRRNSWVRTEQGTAKVIDADVLLQKLVVEFANRKREVVQIGEVLETGLKPPPPPGERGVAERPTTPAATRTDPSAPRRMVPVRLPVTPPVQTTDVTDSDAPQKPEPELASSSSGDAAPQRDEPQRDRLRDRPQRDRPERPKGGDEKKTPKATGDREGSRRGGRSRGRKGDDRTPDRSGENPESSSGRQPPGPGSPPGPSEEKPSEDRGRRRRRRRRRD